MESYRTDALFSDQLPKLRKGERLRLIRTGERFVVHIVSSDKILETVLEGNLTQVTFAELAAFKYDGGEIV